MTGKIKALQASHDSSVEVGGSDDSSNRSNRTDGAFDEGKAVGKSPAIDASAPPIGLVPVCPTPVRAVVGLFSGVLAVGGCVMALYGFRGTQTSPDHDPSLHAGLLGGGLTMLAAGALGVISVFFEREPAPAPAAHA